MKTTGERVEDFVDWFECERTMYTKAETIEEKVQSIKDIKEHIRNTIVKANGKLNYMVVCCASTLEELRYIDRKAVVVVEAVFGNVPLSDNIIIKPK